MEDLSFTKKIAEPTKRIVRQADGFGCCKCGFPIIEYHHIIEDTENPDEIMLLCPIHHHEATVKAMMKEEQWKYKNKPYNIERGFVQGQLKVNQRTPIVNIGSNQIIGTGDLLLVDNERLLALEINEGKIELTMKIHDQENRLIAEIVRNEWVSGDSLPWDLESSFQWIRLRKKLGNIEIEVDSTQDPINIRTRIWKNLHSFQLGPKGIFFDGRLIHVELENTCFVAMKLEAKTNGTFIFSPDRRFGTGAIIQKADKEQRIREGLEVWCGFRTGHNFTPFLSKSRYTVMRCTLCGKLEKNWK